MEISGPIMKSEAGGPVAFLLLLGLVASTPPCAYAASSMSDERIISCFLIGATHPSLCPFTGYFGEDPLFRYSVEPIEADLNDPDARKLDRAYYPRTREILLQSYDMIFFNDARIGHFTAKQFHDLDYAFREGGMASYWAFGPGYGQAIAGSILSDDLPISDYQGWYHQPWHVVFYRDRDPVFLPFIDLGMERVQGAAYAWMRPRPGTVTWADMQPLDMPWLVSWRPGGTHAGLTWVCADECDAYWWTLVSSARGSNPYAIDLATNLVLYSLGRPLISDIAIRREARYRISTFKAQKLTVLSVLEWADMFGANILPLYRQLTDLESYANTALDSYLDQSYDDSIRVMETADSRIAGISANAMDLKDRALFWVYISEWLAVTASGLISGLVVWSLMVHRRLYRPVGSTRLATD